MAGQPLEEFTTLMASTGPAWMTGPEKLINEAVRTTYTGNRIVAAGNMMDMVQGGDQITDTIFLEEVSDFERYNPNDEFSYTNPQTGVTWTVPWAYAKASMSWVKQELGHNVESMGRKYRAQVYKRVMWQKHQNLWTAVNNAIEDEFWARPHEVRMENSAPTGPRKPYSIPCFVNEFADGLPTAIVDSGGDAWTSVMGLSAADSGREKWRCYQACALTGGTTSADQSDPTYPNDEGYTFANTSALAGAGIFPTFSKAWWRLRFDRLPKKPEYSDPTSSPQVIWCGIQGITNYEWALRTNQDEFRGMGSLSGSDPAYPGPKFRGTPIEVISGLDSALLYSTGADNVTEEGADVDGNDDDTSVFATGPRYYFINTEYLKFVTHADNYCVLTDPIRPSKQPHSRVQVMDLWNNVICRAPRRLGIVSPAADTTNA